MAKEAQAAQEARSANAADMIDAAAKMLQVEPEWAFATNVFLYPWQVSDLDFVCECFHVARAMGGKVIAIREIPA